MNVVRVYCSWCVRRLAGEVGEQAVCDADKWYCFFCQAHEQSKCGLLLTRKDWRDRIVHMFAPAEMPRVSL